MANNGKKEFPINGLEEDCTSKQARKVYCYIQNTPRIKSFVKKQLNRRFRKYNKKLTEVTRTL